MSIARVLAVDDEVGQVEILGLYLKDLPLELETAEGPAAACAWLRRERFLRAGIAVDAMAHGKDVMTDKVRLAVSSMWSVSVRTG